MPRRRDDRARVLGPYWDKVKSYWRVMVLTPEAPNPKERRTTRCYREEDEANDAVKTARTFIDANQNRTMGDVIDAYAQHHEEAGTHGYKETIRRLYLFFPDHGLHVGRVTPERCKEYYAAFRQRKKPNGKPISVAYHRAALTNAKTMFTWCIDQGWASISPLADIKGVGKKKSGKKKPTGDELARLYRHCMQRIKDGDNTALGVMMVLSMALRSSDLYKRLVRDVDMRGTQLIVEDAKTEESNEPRPIPDELQSYVRRLIKGREPFEPLFPNTKAHGGGHHTRRWLEEGMLRYCKAAGVPYACPHALKGVSGTVLAREGEAANLVMRHLSHRKKSTTFQHYVDKGVVEQAQAAKAFKIIAGGKR